MEVALIIACFVSNALALYCLTNGKNKTVGALLVLNLCLTVALSYQFKQIKNICYVLMAVAAFILVVLAIKYYIKKKKEKPITVDAKEIENEKD